MERYAHVRIFGTGVVLHLIDIFVINGESVRGRNRFPIVGVDLRTVDIFAGVVDLSNFDRSSIAKNLHGGLEMNRCVLSPIDIVS